MLAMEMLMRRSLTHGMLSLMRIAVVNMPTGPTITDPLLPLQGLPTREKHLRLDSMTNGGLLTHLIHHTIVIITLTLTTPTLIAAAGTNMIRQILESLKDGVEVVRLMIHATRLKTEDGDNGMTVVLPRHHTRNLLRGRHLLRMIVEGRPVIIGL
jgi:hypothetical protein